MDPRYQHPTLASHDVKVRLTTVELRPPPPEPGVRPSPRDIPEVGVWADSAIYSLSASGETPFIMVGAPEGAQIVKRRFWKVCVGDEVPEGARAALPLGHVILMQTEDPAQPQARLVVVFLETQEQAVLRARHRQRPR